LSSAENAVVAGDAEDDGGGGGGGSSGGGGSGSGGSNVKSAPRPLVTSSAPWLSALAARLSHRPAPAELERANVLRGSVHADRASMSIRAAQDTAAHLLARSR
jgi:hypothetical protein